MSAQAGAPSGSAPSSAEPLWKPSSASSLPPPPAAAPACFGRPVARQKQESNAAAGRDLTWLVKVTVVLCSRQSHLSLGLSEQAAEALVPQGPVGELRVLSGLRFLQSQLQLPQGAQLLHQLPLTRPAGLEIQLQVQGGACWLLGQGGAVRLLLTHTYTPQKLDTKHSFMSKLEKNYETVPAYIATFFFPTCSWQREISLVESNCRCHCDITER